ncbi:hypothetical protein CO046_02010 [Candidatus Peregrinibacteria bacterium CG_4_9_14_0_2_um_filter_53_11]|nr:MAG: hypothetical protein CO046_02010 [Candidatus Peregrinibacteria bacterium CG_4_9_14_0_2_um_filter_53_11]
MKKTLSLTLILSLIFILTACGQPAQPLTFFLISSEAGANQDRQSVGCDEFLAPVQVAATSSDLDTDVRVSEALRSLLSADPSAYGASLSTATAFTDGYITLGPVIDQTVGTVQTLIIDLATAEEGGLSGACDAPRVKNQIKETIRANAQNSPFLIRLNGETRQWECFGDESGECL